MDQQYEGHIVAFKWQQWSHKHAMILQYMYHTYHTHIPVFCRHKTWILCVLSGSVADFSAALTCVTCALFRCFEYIYFMESSHSAQMAKKLAC